MSLDFLPLEGIPEIRSGENLAWEVSAAASRLGLPIKKQDLIVIAQKVISKAENRTVNLSTVTPSARAHELASVVDKDARLVEVILSESARIVRQAKGVLITETSHGFICANAGVDHSNLPDPDVVTLLPKNPDESARKLMTELGCGILITDTWGRPWREGLVDACIGLAGLPAFIDLRGTSDRFNNELNASILCVADAISGAAGLLMGKADGIPAVLVRGFELVDRESTALDIVRLPERDLFR